MFEAQMGWLEWMGAGTLLLTHVPGTLMMLPHGLSLQHHELVFSHGGSGFQEGEAETFKSYAQNRYGVMSTLFNWSELPRLRGVEVYTSLPDWRREGIDDGHLWRQAVTVGKLTTICGFVGSSSSLGIKDSLWIYLVSGRCSILKCGLYSAVWAFYVFHPLARLKNCHFAIISLQSQWRRPSHGQVGECQWYVLIRGWGWGWVKAPLH